MSLAVSHADLNIAAHASANQGRERVTEPRRYLPADRIRLASFAAF